MRRTRAWFWVTGVALFLCLPRGVTRDADVLTQHNDNYRTGANLHETRLTPEKVKQGFGRLFSRAVDGQIYAQPLVASDLEIPGKGLHNVVFVATMKNNVYAFDADKVGDDEPLWKLNLGAPVPFTWIPSNLGSMLGLYNIRPFIGITSTPVIDPAKERMWVFAKSMGHSGEVHQKLFCLDIKKGSILGATGDIQVGDGDDRLRAETALQRPALLLANDSIYVAFGSHQDASHYHGWLVAFDAVTLRKKFVFCTTPGEKSGQGAIWQSGNGPAADAAGDIYIITGNGLFEPGQQYGSSFVKLDPRLNVLGWFTPSNYKWLNREDLDLGSTGPVLLPGSQELIGAGKEGVLYVLNRDQLGGLQRKHSVAPAVQQFRASHRKVRSFFNFLDPFFEYNHIHGSPVFWKGSRRGAMIYIWPESTRLKAFAHDPSGLFETHPVATGPKAPKGMPGGILSISADGTNDGILWASLPLKDDAFVNVVQGVLLAFDANTLTELWNSEASAPEDIFAFAKFCPPTICNGKVYLATFSDKLNVYGLVPPPAPLPSWARPGDLLH